jgi:hypothetical protein
MYPKIGQSFGLFLVALMDHLVAVLSDRWSKVPPLSPHQRERSRYVLGLGVLYFLASAIAVDATLQNYWEVNYKLSNEKLVDAKHARLEARKLLMWVGLLYFIFRSLTF